MNFKKIFSNMILGLMTATLFSTSSFAMETNGALTNTSNEKHYEIIKISENADSNIRTFWGEKLLAEWGELPETGCADRRLYISFRRAIKKWMRKTKDFDNSSLYLLKNKNEKIDAFLILSFGENDDVRMIEGVSKKSTQNYQLYRIDLFAGWDSTTHEFGGGSGAMLLSNILKSFQNKVFVYLEDETKKEKGKCSYYAKHGFTPVGNEIAKEYRIYNWMYQYIDSPKAVKYYKPIGNLEITELK